MKAYNTIDEIVKGLKQDYPKLTDYELLSIAVQQQRNEILVAGLNISRTDNHPSALEAIAIQTGYNQPLSDLTIIDSLNQIADNMDLKK